MLGSAGPSMVRAPTEAQPETGVVVSICIIVRAPVLVTDKDVEEYTFP
jgi:hypothetical protein